MFFAASVPLIRTSYAKEGSKSDEPVTNVMNEHVLLHNLWASGTNQSTGSHNTTYTGLGSDPINWHDNDLACGSFFETTDENIEASNFGQAYFDWLNHVGQNSTIWNHGDYEVNIFLKDVMGWIEDVTCGVGNPGCKNMPSCDNVYNRIRDPEHARQAWFVIQSVNNINVISYTTNVSPHP